MDIDKIALRIASEKTARDSMFLKNLIHDLRSEIDRCKNVAKEFSLDEDTAEEGWKILKAIPALEKAISNISSARFSMKTAKTYPVKYFTRPDVKVGYGQYGLLDIENSDLTGEGLLAKMDEWKRAEGGVPEYVWNDMVPAMQKKGVRPPNGTRKISSVLE